MLQHAPATPDTADSILGKAIHTAVELGDDSVLSEEEAVNAANNLRDATAQIVYEWSRGVDAVVMIEERLGQTILGKYLKVAESEPVVRFAVTGLPDFVAVAPERALILDYKSCRWGLYDTATNAQLRTLAVLVAGYFNVDEVTVGIVQPMKDTQLAVFDSAALASARAWLAFTLKKSKDAAARIAKAWLEGPVKGKQEILLHATPGKHCQYCPGLIDGRCPAATQQAVAATVALAGKPSTEVDREALSRELWGKAMRLPAAELLRLKGDVWLMKMVMRAVDDAMVARVNAADPEDAEILARWEMKPGALERKIVNPVAALAELRESGVILSDEGFLSAVDVRLGDLEEAIRQESGPKITSTGKPHATQKAISGEQAKKIVSGLSSNALTTKQKAPTLVQKQHATT